MTISYNAILELEQFEAIFKIRSLNPRLLYYCAPMTCHDETGTCIKFKSRLQLPLEIDNYRHGLQWSNVRFCYSEQRRSKINKVIVQLVGQQDNDDDDGCIL